MELILLKDIEKVGRKGDVVRVRDGFARNFLFPQKAALQLTAASQRFGDEQKTRAAKRLAEQKAEAEKAAKKIESTKFVLRAASGEHDKLFGSVTTEDISALLAEKGFVIDKKKVLIKEPIKALGNYTISIEVFPQVKASLQLEVLRKD